MNDQMEIERRISTESRLTKVEERIVNMQDDIHSTNTFVSTISTSLQNVAAELAETRVTLLTAFKTASTIGTILILLITGAFAVGWISLPSINHHLEEK